MKNICHTSTSVHYEQLDDAPHVRVNDIGGSEDNPNRVMYLSIGESEWNSQLTLFLTRPQLHDLCRRFDDLYVEEFLGGPPTSAEFPTEEMAR